MEVTIKYQVDQELEYQLLMRYQNGLEATVTRDGKIWRQTFRRGKSAGDIEQIGEAPVGEHGTVIKFKADHEIFEATYFT